VRIVFKMHPLPMHQNAQFAAEAALAANAQGKFHEMSGKLFENQRSLTRDTILRLAREIGLDMDRFIADLDTHAHLATIREETRQVEAIGATGTPASFVNGRYVNGAKPYAVFRAMIEEELKWSRDGNRPKFRAGANVREVLPQSAAPAAPDPAKALALRAGDAPSMGPADAKVTILHYMDYQ